MKFIQKPGNVDNNKQESAEIKNDSDLQKAQSDLDNTNLDSLDTALGQNDADAAQF